MITLIKKEWEALEAQMINITYILALALVIILSVFVTYLCCRGKSCDMFMEGYLLGISMSRDEGEFSLKEIFIYLFDGSIDSFINISGGLIYKVDNNEQLEMIVIDTEEQLEELFDYKVIEMFRDGDYGRLIIKENV